MGCLSQVMTHVAQKAWYQLDVQNMSGIPPQSCERTYFFNCCPSRVQLHSMAPHRQRGKQFAAEAVLSRGIATMTQ